MPDDEKEGTAASLGTWLKAKGAHISENEPLVEINTDKVTIEIPAPAAGTIYELYKQPGDEVLPGEVLASINTEDKEVEHEKSASIVPEQKTASANAANAPTPETTSTYSPAVRKLLTELGLDAEMIPKVSRGGRMTPQDIGAYLRRGNEGPDVAPAAPAFAPPARADVFTGRKLPHTPMRKSIAAHMARSVQVAPHVTSVFEADFYNVLSDRETRKQASGGNAVPSVTAYLIRAAITAIKAYPEVNSKWHDTDLELFDAVNFGVGTALDTGGLVVPVIRDADRMDLLTLSESLREMTRKARAGKLTQRDMEGGTFTLSNHGVSGSLLATPIILPHGQAAILGAGKLQKRVIVCETGGRELFRVRPMMYVTLTVDHRVLDGQQTNGFLTALVQALEHPF